jgi:hypothetical protein
VTFHELATVVRHYKANHQHVPVAELDYFRSHASDEEAVGDAAMCRVNGKKLSHQRRISRGVLEEARRRLVDNLDGLRAAETFEELYDDVEAVLGPILGIGELAVYDIALRIGARFDLSPARVYLHAGTRDGAKALGLSWRSKTIGVGDLPVALRNLTAREAEDVLCIYKSYFRTGVVTELQRGCGPAAAAVAMRC